MKSLVAVARNAVRPAEPKTPVAYARKSDRLSLPLSSRSDAEAQMRTYQSVPALYACAAELAEATGQVEWHLWREHPSGRVEDRTEVTEATGGHAALDLWEAPNPFMDRSFFVEMVQLHLDLAGEAFIVIGSDDRAPDLPLSLWPVIPTMMAPVPDRKKFLSGYVFTDPDGQQVPFGRDQVIHFKYPNPLNMYRGMSPVLALLVDLDAARYSTEWTRAFFSNSAEPGGVIEVEEAITDDEFNEFAARWEEQHRGTANAHRIAILTNGMKWVQRSYSMRDLQFTELQKASDERVMLGMRMGKTLLGQTEGVNRATAEAAEYVFGKYRVQRRLNRFRRMLNKRILPRYDPDDMARRRSVERPLHFDYESPVTDNAEEANADRASRVDAWSKAVAGGADPISAAEAYGLPEMSFGGSEGVIATPREAAEMIQKIYLGVGAVVTWDEARSILRRAGIELTDAAQPLPAGPGLPMAAAALRSGGLTAHLERITVTAPHEHLHHPLPALPRAQGEFDLDPADLPDVGPLEDSFQRILQRLLAQWEGIEGAQKQQIAQAVLAIAQGGSIEQLTQLINAVDLEPATDALDEAMAEAARDGADALVAEAAAQGVSLEPQPVSAVTRRGAAALIAHNLASRLATSASQEAIRVNSGDATPEEVAAAVGLHLQGLSPLTPKGPLSGALTGSQNEARLQTLKAGPAGAIYASEKNDANTCSPCRSIDGKWLGNTDDMDSATALYPGGGYGGYVDCEGRERCRGTITGVWRRGIGDVPPQPVAQPEPAPEPAPAFAEPTPLPPDPVTADRARRADALRAVIAAEDRAVERINRSGAQGLTEIVVLGDGRRVVAKQLRDPYGRVTADQRIEADAEELVNRVAVAVGVDAPVLERTGRTELRLEFVDAPPADELPHSERERLWTSTDSGRLVGLLDLVTGNTDRHAGNWFADGDRVIPIDHGYTFNPGDELLGEVFEATSSVFADHFAEWGPSGQVIRASNDMSPDDMAVIGDRLRGLRPEFERLGHRDWHDYMMSTFDEAARAASGDRSRLGL